MEFKEMFIDGFEETDRFLDLVLNSPLQDTEIDLGGKTYELNREIHLGPHQSLKLRNGKLIFLGESNNRFCIFSNKSTVSLNGVDIVDNRTSQPGAIGVIGAIQGEVRIRDCKFSNFDNYGIYARECVRPLVEASEFTGKGSGTAVQYAGCRHGLMQHLTAKECGFAFSLIGKEYSDNAESGYWDKITKPVEWSIGNTIFACHSENCTGTTFNANGTNGNVILACTDDMNTGDHPSFQVKHPTNNIGARYNKFALCHAQRCRTGYYGQGNSRTVLLGNSSCDTKNYGIRMNFSLSGIVAACIVDNFGTELLPNPKAVTGGIVARNSANMLIDNCVVKANMENAGSGRLLPVSVESSAGVQLGQMVEII